MDSLVDLAVIGSVGYTAGPVDLLHCDRCAAVVAADRVELHDRWHGSSVLDLVVADLARTQDELDPIRLPYRTRPHLYVVVNPPWPQTDTADDRIPEDHRTVLRQTGAPDDGPTGHLFSGMANIEIRRDGILFANTDLSEGLDDSTLVAVHAHDNGAFRMVAGMGSRAAGRLDVTHLMTMTHRLMRLVAGTSAGLYPDHLHWTVGIQVDQLRGDPRLRVDGYVRVGSADWPQLACPDVRPYFDALCAD